MQKNLFQKISILTALTLFFVASMGIKNTRAADLSDTLRGRILLQVEQSGEAWYINPLDGKKYYMGRPLDAFNLMRSFGLGITNANLEKIPVAEANFLTAKDSDNDGLSDMIEDAFGTDKYNPDTDGDGYDDKSEILGGFNPLGLGRLPINEAFAARFLGRILLQVEQNGEAWYVFPLDGKRYYMGRPLDAFNLMRSLGLGITDLNLEKITISKDSKIPEENELEENGSEENGIEKNGPEDPDKDKNGAIDPEPIYPDRKSQIPPAQVKITPQTDIYPPIIHSNEFQEPVPLPGPVNTAGAEDSAFIMPDGQTLYFWFTPSPQIPPEKQVIDGVTGIYVSEKINNQWQEPERVILQKEGKLALDGCQFIANNEMIFCSTREGYTDMNWFRSEFKDGKWTVGEYDQELSELADGELHIVGDYLYFDAPGPGSADHDIWVSKRENGSWGKPESIAAVNTEANESRPFVNQANNELWFTRNYLGSPAVFRSKKVNNQWQEPELIISQFAGEPTLDNAGNLYFIHHFFKDGKMLEADVYVAYKK